MENVPSFNQLIQDSIIGCHLAIPRCGPQDRKAAYTV